VLAVTLALAWASPVAAHVAPSEQDNNRYLKVTPQADRLRISYTVFFGSVPGAKLRPTIDANRDKSIDEAEARAFGDKIAAELAASLDVVVDGKARKLAWETVAVGMGSQSIFDGAFSVDLIAYLCFDVRGGDHAFQIHDRYKVTNPGETEVRVEDVPDIKLTKVKLGVLVEAALHEFRIVGPATPMMDDGLDVALTAGPRAPVSGACKGAQAAASKGPSPAIIIAIVVLGIAVGVAGSIVMRRRAAAKRP